MRKLEETGVISGYQALIEPAVMGRAYELTGVRLVRHARVDIAAFDRAVVALPEVVFCHHVTGNFDYLLHGEVADVPAYDDFHANRLVGLPAWAAVNSYVTMKTP